MRRRVTTVLGLMLLLTGAARSGTWPVTRPVTTFKGEKRMLHMYIRDFKKHDEAGLRKLFEKCPRDFRKDKQPYERALRSAVGLWEMTKDEQYRDLAVRGTKAALSKWAKTSPSALAKKVTAGGAKDEINAEMRDACYHSALLYHLTGEVRYAGTSAALLKSFGEKTPKWPLYLPHYVPYEEREVVAQDDKTIFTRWDCAGLWGGWIYGDLHAGAPLLEAYDLIESAGTVRKLRATQSVEAMFHRHLDVQFRYGRTLFNMDPSQMRGFLRFARGLKDPELVHYVATWLKDLMVTCYYADGWWHEGTPSYFKQALYGCRAVAKELRGYSDPPGFVSKDGTRYDDLDTEKVFGRMFARSHAALADTQQPNRLCQVIHDTAFPQPTWWTPAMKEARSILSGCVGHAILGTGKGKDAMAQATLHFGGTHGHEHYDTLNLILFARGRELISETRYRTHGASNSSREWQTSTAGHVTVVVDGKNQTGRQDPETPKRIPEPEDAVPGAIEPRWRWSGHGNALNDGKLRLFNSDFDQVQVIEADAERCYGFETRIEPTGAISYQSDMKLDLYRRTVALVKISADDVYVVDIFRVKGGETHDYMLHGCLDVPHGLEIPLEFKARRGKLHTHIEKLQAATTDKAWTATFAHDDGAVSLRTFMMGAPGTEIIRGVAPAMRRNGIAPYVAVRRTGGESVFVAVHHPYAKKPLVKKVQLLPVAEGDDMAVAIRVTLPDRVDTILSTLGAGEDLTTRNGLAMTGRFAHVAEGKDGWAYLVDGERLVAPGCEIKGTTHFSGRIIKTKRVEAGDKDDAFVTRTELPTDGSLNGRTLMIDEGGLLVQSFRIRDIVRKGRETHIRSLDEPGLTITGALIKQNYYPCWGIKGEARFRIAGSVLKRSEAK